MLRHNKWRNHVYDIRRNAKSARMNQSRRRNVLSPRYTNWDVVGESSSLPPSRPVQSAQKKNDQKFLRLGEAALLQPRTNSAITVFYVVWLDPEEDDKVKSAVNTFNSDISCVCVRALSFRPGCVVRPPDDVVPVGDYFF